MLVEIIAFLVVMGIMFLVFKLVKNVLLMILNTIMGAFAIFGFNYIFSSDVLISIWSILIVGVGGIIGFLVVIGCHFLGWAF